MLQTDVDQFEVLTINEAAALLRVSPSKARQLAAGGELPGVLPRLGKQWRINRRALEDFINAPVAQSASPGE